MIGPTARSADPAFRQVFIARGAEVASNDTFERKRYVIRKRLEHAIWDSPLTGASNDQRRGIPRLQQGPRATVETTRRRKPSVTDERPME